MEVVMPNGGFFGVIVNIKFAVAILRCFTRKPMGDV